MNDNIEVRLATIEEVEDWWNKKISKSPKDMAYKSGRKTLLKETKMACARHFLLLKMANTLVKGLCFWKVMTRF